MDTYGILIKPTKGSEYLAPERFKRWEDAEELGFDYLNEGEVEIVVLTEANEINLG